MLTSARNPFEIVMIFAGLLAGIIGIVGLFGPDGYGLLSIYGLHSRPAQVFYPGLVLGTGAVACSLRLPLPMTLLIERVGMIWLAALFVPYGVFLIILLHLNPTWILSVGYGVACAARSRQITQDLQRYRREPLRITSESP
jgi:hypothetical protein